VDAELVVSRLLSPDDVADIQDAFRGFGVTTSARTAPRRRGQELTWLVLVSLPLSGFLTTLGASMAEEAHKGLCRLVRRVLGRGEALPDRARALVLEDRTSGAFVVLDLDLPDEAYSALFSTDLDTGATFRFDPAQHRWMATTE
jgi:hypothetical protein